MFKPNYTLTNKLFTNITTSERLYGQIEALRLPGKLELNLKRNNLIESTFASNRIEGNSLSLPEVTNLLLDDRVPTNRDEKEVSNYFDVLEDLPNYVSQNIDLDLVAKIHKLIFTGVHQQSGEFRNEIVAVGRYVKESGTAAFKVKHLPPFHAQVEIKQAIEELLTWTNKSIDLPIILRAGIFHHQFVYIHPFEDGNGRVCRMLSALLFLKANYHINKYFILDDYYDIDRINYSDMLHKADDGDKTEWLEYFSDGVKYSLQSALAKAKNSLRTLSISERPSSKEKEVLDIMLGQPEITSTEIAGQLHISRQQAHNLLSALVKKDLITRQGSTKSSYYKLK